MKCMHQLSLEETSAMMTKGTDITLGKVNILAIICKLHFGRVTFRDKGKKKTNKYHGLITVPESESD